MGQGDPASDRRSGVERQWRGGDGPLAMEHHWIEEGLATYVEPIARAQAGQFSVKLVWRDLVVGLPRGLPQPGDRGLDFTPTWGRTYWGGALFCLLADIEIRKRMNLSLSCDHRVVDGWDAASFMQALKGLIENPLRLLSA